MSKIWQIAASKMSRACSFLTVYVFVHNITSLNHRDDRIYSTLQNYWLLSKTKTIIMHVGLNIFLPMVLFLFYFHHFRSHHALCCCACCCHVPPNFPPNANFTVNHTSLSTCQCRTKQIVRGATLINKISHIWSKFWRARKGLVTPARI